MRKLTIILALTLLVAAVVSVGASASFGCAAEVIASDVTVIRTAPLGEKIVFSDTDVKSALALLNFDTITIKSLPKEEEGRLLFAGKTVKEGQTIKRRNIPSLVFIPTSKEVTEAAFTFTVDGYASDLEIKCLMKFIERVNYAPTAGEISDGAVLTWQDISHHGRLYATDPEGDEIEFMVVEYPRYGYLTLKDNGEYIYTPTSGYVGKDGFSYVCRDEYGNYSNLRDVRITVDEKMCEISYTDMQNRREHGAAVVMTAMGIMSGRTIGDGVYFEPDEHVTRAEFIALAMKSLGIKQDTTVSATFFDDDDAIPAALRGYIATAQRIGLAKGNFTDGKLLFNPNDPITKYDAAVIMATLKGGASDNEESVFAEYYDVPVYARGSVLAMYSIGVFDYNDEGAETDSVTRADAAHYLYKLLES